LVNPLSHKGVGPTPLMGCSRELGKLGEPRVSEGCFKVGRLTNQLWEKKEKSGVRLPQKGEYQFSGLAFRAKGGKS
jgi:hypothetical protein